MTSHGYQEPGRTGGDHVTHVSRLELENQMRRGYSSKADACKDKAHRPFWEVVVRNGNYSAFNGYHFTPSDYSLVRCTSCGALWRTKAKFVYGLPDARGG